MRDSLTIIGKQRSLASSMSEAAAEEFAGTSGSSDASGDLESVGEEEEKHKQQKRVAETRASFFHVEKDLGILRLDVQFKRKSSCFFCSNPIATTDAVRGVYAYHTKRPHAYVHVACLARLEDRFVQRCTEKLREVATLVDGTARAAVETAIVSLQERQ